MPIGRLALVSGGFAATVALATAVHSLLLFSAIASSLTLIV